MLFPIQFYWSMFQEGWIYSNRAVSPSNRTVNHSNRVVNHSNGTVTKKISTLKIF